jgi:hypothetical protein
MSKRKSFPPLLSTRDEVASYGLVNVWPYNINIEAYVALHNDKLDKLPHIPHSAVFYVRNLLEAETGYYFPLDMVEAAMVAEGWRGR